MKRKPEILPIKVPERVVVNMSNDMDYVYMPVSNLDADELNELCVEFVSELYKKASYTVLVNITLIEK